MMDPEQEQAMSAQSAAPAPAAGQEPDGDEQADTGPLDKIELEGAQDGNVIATHHPHVPERVKAMGMAEHKPHKYALKKDEVEGHVKKHKARLHS